MDIIISHQSALEYWRVHRALPSGSVKRMRESGPPNNPPTTMQVRCLGLEQPVHIMIRNPGSRWSSHTMVQHVFTSKTPAGCFVKVSDKLFVSSPEFCFLQLADHLPLIKLIELGYELCGMYSQPATNDPSPSERGFYNRQPLINAEKLEAFIASMPGVKGHKKALRALRYILNDAASPMETKLSILLTLPYQLGGFGLIMPELNSRIIPSKTIRKSTSKAFYACDLYWPDYALAVEYDSDQYHTGSERIADDAKRKNALASLGVMVITITKQQIYSPLELEKTAKLLARNMEKRLLYNKQSFALAHHELRKQLF